MGFHVTSGSADTAPGFFFNHAGESDWSGKKAAELSDEDIADLLDFASQFAHSEAHRNALQRRGEEPWNPFHPTFLEGRPHAVWERSYAEGLASGAKEREELRLDEKEEQERQRREAQRQEDMWNWTEHIAFVMYRRATEESRCRSLGTSWLEMKLFPLLVKRAQRKSPFFAWPYVKPTALQRAFQPVHDQYRRLRWRVFCWLNRRLPIRPRYWVDQVPTLIRRRHKTHYQLQAFYYASTILGKRPRHWDIYNNLTRLEAIAMTWQCLREGACRVTVTGYLEVPAIPYAGGQLQPLRVDRLGWDWHAGMHDEPYLGWPRT